jgi:RNA polymerase sigma factor for flagellar operon FliA
MATRRQERRQIGPSISRSRDAEAGVGRGKTFERRKRAATHRVAEPVMAMQDLVEKYLGYAHAIAAEVLKKCPRHVEREDVNRAAEFGLAQAARAYDPSRGISFKTFAYYRVKGAIYDDLRTSWRAAKFDEAATEFMREYSESAPRGTTPEERYKEIKEIASSVASSYLLSLEGLQDEPEQRTAESPLESVLRGEEQGVIAAALAQLPAKNRQVLRKYYFEGLSFEEIGREMGLSRSWVCRLHAKGLALMGESLRNPKFRFIPRAPERERHIPSALTARLAFA